MTPLMSRAAEQKIVRVAEDAVERLADDDQDPNQAIAKAAADHNLPREHLGLVATAYNIGRTNVQRAEGEDTLDRAAPFKLAGVEQIEAVLYPAAIKTAAPVASTEVAPMYFAPPVAPPRWTEEKLAAALVARQVPVVDSPRFDDDDAKHEYGRRQRLKLAAAEATRQMFALEDQFRTGLQALATYFSKAGSASTRDVWPNIAILHGDAGLAVLDYLEETRPHIKKAAVQSRRLQPVRPDQSPYREFAVVMALSPKVAAARAAHRAALDALPEPLWKTQPAPLSADIEFEGIKIGVSFSSVPDKVVNAGIYRYTSDAMNRFLPPGKDVAVGKALREIATPEHEQNLRTIQAQAMLHDLLNDDDVLSGYDPHEVASHYNRISDTAPMTSQKSLFMIPALRKSLAQGHLDTFEARELADTENKLRTLDQPKAHPDGK